MNIKNIDGGVLDVSTAHRKVKVAINKMGVLDHDKDMIDKTAFNRSIKQRGPGGSNMIWHLTDHIPSLKSAVGKFSELYTEKDYLTGVTVIPNTQWGNDVMEFYKTGAINQHSIGFKTVNEETQNKGKPDEYNLIKEVMLYEGSAVLWGANEDTPTISVGKSMGNGMVECPYCHKPTKDVESGMGYIKCENCNKTFNTQKTVNEEYSKTLEELTNFTKLFKTGHLSDSSFELIEIRISQLADKLKQLFEKATQPASQALDPVEKSLLDVLTTFNNSFKSTHNDPRRIAVTT